MNKHYFQKAYNIGYNQAMIDKSTGKSESPGEACSVYSSANTVHVYIQGRAVANAEDLRHCIAGYNEGKV